MTMPNTDNNIPDSEVMAVSHFTKLVHPFFFERGFNDASNNTAQYKVPFRKKEQSIEEINVWQRVDSDDDIKKLLPTKGLYPYVNDIFHSDTRGEGNRIDSKERRESETSVFVLNKRLRDQIFLSPVCILMRDIHKKPETIRRKSVLSMSIRPSCCCSDLAKDISD